MKRNWYYNICLVLWLIGIVCYFFSEKSFLTVWANSHRSESLDVFFKWYTRIAEWILIVFPLLFCWWFKGVRLMLAAGILFILEALIVNGSKQWWFYHEPRPSVDYGTQLKAVEGVPLLQWNSFPSGHTAVAFLGFGILAYLTSNKILQSVFALLAALMGYSRMYLGQHFLRDVCAGTAISLLLLWFLPQLQKQMEKIKIKGAIS